MLYGWNAGRERREATEAGVGSEMGKWYLILNGIA